MLGLFLWAARQGVFIYPQMHISLEYAHKGTKGAKDLEYVRKGKKAQKNYC